ncbi:putative membrane protein YesL [Sphingobium sp. B2D3B]|nr:putative membrane protein YesL [Sphingobium sp. B2D3B]
MMLTRNDYLLLALIGLMVGGMAPFARAIMT